MRPLLKRLLVCLVAIALACGKRGDPRPPVPVIPQPTSDLVVTQRGDKVILSWSYPSLTTAGRSLAEIRQISILRYVEELPASPAPLPPAVAAPQFVKLSTKVESIEKANLASATEGAKLIYADTPPLRTADGRPLRLTYAVVTEGTTARSEPSNLATIVPLPAVPAPAGVTAKAAADGVTVSWTETAQSPAIGYSIYRNAPAEEVTELTAPINATPVKGSSFHDTPPYGEHEYRVAAVAATGPPLVQSDLSAPVSVTFRDLVPPPAPTGVTALVETKLLRLVWEPVTAPDLAGYFVYRWERDVRLKLCCPTPIAQENFLDISMQLGTSYRYDVTAVDKSGNESAPGKSETIIIPKTPGS